MNTQAFRSMMWGLVACCVLSGTALAQDAGRPAGGQPGADQSAAAHSSADQSSDDQPSADQPSADQPSADQPSADHSDEPAWDSSASGKHYRGHHHFHTNDVVSIGKGAELGAGQHAESVVAVFGSAVSAGDVDDTVVSVMGHTRITGGRVGNSAVAVMGSVYVNGEVDGDVVAVLGNVELGPEARVRGNVVTVGGQLRKDPSATIDGEVQSVVDFDWGSFEWLQPWVDRCLLYGRPLAFSAGLEWAWGVALGLLALYVFVAFLFRGAVEQCVHTLEARPGKSVLAAFLTVLVTPVLFLLLVVTILGIAAIPFLILALLVAAMFGKIVALAYIGRRCTPMLAQDPVAHTVVGVIVGGAIALVLYTIPIVGAIVYKLLEILGFGAVMYTLLLAAREGRAGPRPGGPATASTAGVAGGAPGGSAGAAGPGMSAGSPAGAVGTGGLEQPPGSGGGAGAPPGGGTGGGSTGNGGPGSNLGNTQDPAALLTYPRAGFAIRMAALLLDLILVGIVLHVTDHGARVHLLGLAAYGAVMWKLKGSTIGGIICGLRVVRLDGRPVDWPTAIARALSCFLSLAIAGLGFIWIAIDAGRQAWHDKIAGTVVVRVPKAESLV